MMLRSGLPVFVFFAAFITTAASAQTTTSRKLVVHLEGIDSGKIRREILRMVPPELQVANAKDFASPWGRSASGKLTQRLRNAGSKIGATTVLVGRTETSSKRRRRIWLFGIETASGKIVIDKRVSVSTRRRRKRRSRRRRLDYTAVKAAFRRVLRTAKRAELLPATSTVPGVAQQVEAESVQAVAFTGDSSEYRNTLRAQRQEIDEVDFSSAWLIVQPFYRMSNRNLKYRDPQPTNLRAYSAGTISSIGVQIETYPLRQKQYLRDVGVYGSYSRDLSLDSLTVGGQRFGTTFDSLNIGLKGRVLLGPILVSPSFGYGRQRFTFSANPGDATPGVSYQYLRPAIEARAMLGYISLLGSAGYRYMLSGSQIGDTSFPESSLLGFDLEGGIAAGLGSYEVQVTAAYERISFDLPPTTSSAVDDYLNLKVGFSAMF